MRLFEFLKVNRIRAEDDSEQICCEQRQLVVNWKHSFPKCSGSMWLKGVVQTKTDGNWLHSESN